MKLSLFAGDIILYIDHLKDSFLKLLKVFNKFSNVAGYKSQRNLQDFLYINYELYEKEVNNPIHNSIKTTKYIGTNLTKVMEDLCPENYDFDERY